MMEAGVRGEMENSGGDEPTQGTLYMYIWKCHTETPYATVIY
jgi:hypothetical protein